MIAVPLYNSNSYPSNADFLREYVSTLLQNAFPHLQRYSFHSMYIVFILIFSFYHSNQVKLFIRSMFEFNNNPTKFKLEVRDFLIQLKEFAGENAELYLEEKEKELEAQRKAEMQTKLAIPGMVKPSELPVMDEDEAL